ncbi:MAG: acyltransferase family protein [Paracoccaceae bacterium]|nr:acyltransferase family protein [Paracoccaceae bacterium]
MQYRPDIDGLRAVAVIPVVFYHAGLAGFSGGFVGVDVFFVISGYLITRIIHDEMLQGRFSILSFYERRARRILPALLAVLAASFVAGWVWLGPADYDAMARAAGAVLLFVSNVWFWQNSGGYFDGSTDYLPLLHTWSLAVEEQFYILFPLLLLVLVRLGQRTTLGVTLTLVVASLALAAWATPRMPSASFYLLPTRVWELGVGALLALGLAPTAAPRWLREAVAGLGLAAIVYAVTAYDGATAFPGLAALPPVLGAAALIWAGGAGGSLAGQALSWRPVVFVGLLSYSLYLWHWPVMAFARNWLMALDLPFGWQLGTIALSLALAWASWRLIERPFRTGRGRSLSPGPIFALSGAGMAALGAAALAVVLTGGAEQRYSPEQRALLASLNHADDIRACRGARPVEALCTFGDGQGVGGRWLLWGDSHAEAVLPAVETLAREAGASLDFASDAACAPLPGVVRSDRDPGQRTRCLGFNDRLARHAQTGGYDTVILHARWPLYVEGVRQDGHGAAPIVLARSGTDVFAAGPSDNANIAGTSLSALATRLTEAGLKVVLVGPVPELPWDLGTHLKAAVLHSRPLPDPPAAAPVHDRQARTRALLMDVAEASGATWIPLAPHLCTDTCHTHDGLAAFYRDDNHLSPTGATRLALPALRTGWPSSAMRTGQ